MGPAGGVLGTTWALLGPFLTTLGLSGGVNVCILSFLGHQDQLEPHEKSLGSKKSLEKIPGAEGPKMNTSFLHARQNPLRISNGGIFIE